MGTNRTTAAAAQDTAADHRRSCPKPRDHPPRTCEIAGECRDRRRMPFRHGGMHPSARAECSHANGNLIAFRPVSAEQAGTAIDAKGFHCAFSFSVNTNQV